MKRAGNSGEIALENFKIDSSGWHLTDLETAWGSEVKTNPERDIWEITLPDGKSEQLFSYGAAIREVAKAGKKLPDMKDWTKLLTRINPDIDISGNWQDDETVRKLLSPVFVGFRHSKTSSYYDQGIRAYYWSKGPSRSVGYAIGISATQVAPVLCGHSNCGFSVRCVE